MQICAYQQQRGHLVRLWFTPTNGGFDIGSQDEEIQACLYRFYLSTAAFRACAGSDREVGGFEGVDIGVFADGSHVQPKDIVRNVPKAACDLSAKLEQCGLELSDIFLIPGAVEAMAANHTDPNIRRRSRDTFQRVLECTVRCNGRHMSALAGVHWDKESHKDSLQRSAEELAWRLEQAKQVGVVFSVEPHVGSIVPTPKEAEQLVKLTPGLTLTLDYSHFVCQSFFDREIEPLISYASHFHARGACNERNQTPLKDSTIHYQRVLQTMSRCKYSGYICLEFEYFDVEPGNEIDTLSETILLRDLLQGAKE